jgi:hypothetical protein
MEVALVKNYVRYVEKSEQVRERCAVCICTNDENDVVLSVLYVSRG